MQCKLDWFSCATSPWALVIYIAVVAAIVWVLSSQGLRRAFWIWLTDERFYKHFGFLGLLWPQQPRNQVWPPVMEDAKAVYLEGLQRARQFGDGQLPKWWVILANVRFLLQVTFLAVEMSRVIAIATVQAIPFRKRRRSRRIVS